jgi:hypothetical protein
VKGGKFCRRRAGIVSLYSFGPPLGKGGEGGGEKFSLPLVSPWEGGGGREKRGLLASPWEKGGGGEQKGRHTDQGHDLQEAAGMGEGPRSCFTASIQIKSGRYSMRRQERGFQIRSRRGKGYNWGGYFPSLWGRQGFTWGVRQRDDWIRVNDPSAGSPTETLLRLLLPLNDQV